MTIYSLAWLSRSVGKQQAGGTDTQTGGACCQLCRVPRGRPDEGEPLSLACKPPEACRPCREAGPL